MNNNIFASFINLLNVKHTVAYSVKFFNEHPHKYNLFGLSDMLSSYGVESMGVHFKDKTEILSVDVPFIAHTGSDFVIVEEVSGDEIRFIERNKKIKVEFREFLEMWSGYALLAESNKSSIEPDYNIHSRKEFFHLCRNISIFSLVVFILVFAFISNGNYKDAGLISLLLINVIGGYIGYLLVLKQLRIQSNYADRLCSLFKYSDCNNILDSKAAKLFGLIGWSEIGLGYFISNVVILSIFPSLVDSLLLVNVFSVPFTIWSIWFQKVRARQWCPLCLISVLLLWAIFLIGIISGYFSIPVQNVAFWEITVICSLYLVSILIINILIPVIARGNKMQDIQYEINSIIADEDVFNTLLQKQQYYPVDKATSRILFGNPESSQLVTIFSNPHCNPCSSMHVRVNKLLEQRNDICIQYIFSSFSKELDVSNKYLLAVYQQENGKVKEIFDEWFKNGKSDKERFFEANPVDITKEEVTEEFKKHELWKAESGLRATPTILVNGYKLPDNFKIEDIMYIT